MEQQHQNIIDVLCEMMHFTFNSINIICIYVLSYIYLYLSES